MIGRMTLREIREALAAAKAKKGPKAPVTPTVRELESLARQLELDVEKTPTKKPAKKREPKAHGAADDGRNGSPRSARPRGPRR